MYKIITLPNTRKYKVFLHFLGSRILSFACHTRVYRYYILNVYIRMHLAKLNIGTDFTLTGFYTTYS